MGNKSSKLESVEKWLSWIWPVCFILAGWHYLVSENSDMLFMAQEKSLFYGSRVYFNECMQLPGGLLSYAGSYLMQFFYIPALGSGILIALWLILAFAIKFGFKVKMTFLPLAFVVPVLLLISVIDMGYWLYYMKFVGYFFVPTLGFIFVALWAAVRLPKKGLWTIPLALTYPLFGFYTLLAMAVTALCAVKGSHGTDKKLHTTHGKWYIMNVAIPLVLALATPVLWYRFYTELAIERSWIAGIPLFEAEEVANWTLSLPFIFSIVWMLAMALPIPFKIGTPLKRIVCCILVAVASAYAINSANFDNYNYHAEMRMYKAAENFDWDEILREAARIPGDATREMVIMKNIALFNKGTAGSQFFHYNNMGEKPYVQDSLKVHMVQTAASMLYLHHGKVNFSTRWCIENSVEFGYNYDNLKILTLSALVSEEYKLARKYLDILSNTIYQKKWAERYLPATSRPSMLSEENVGKYYPELANIVDLRNHMGSVLDGDNGIPEMYLINYFSRSMNKDSKYFQEMTLDYALVQKDIQLFWPRFIQYAMLNKDKSMPIHYQEAAYLYGKLEPQTMDISQMPFDKQQIVERYERFNQTAQSLINSRMDSKQVGEAMKSTYGDTFWWFYFFCRDITSY